MKYHVIGGGLDVKGENPHMALTYRDDNPEDFKTWLELYPRHVGSEFGWGSSRFLEFVEVLIEHKLWKVLGFESMMAYIDHMIPDAREHINEVKQVDQRLGPIKADAEKEPAQGKRTDTLPNNIRKLEQGTSQEYTLRRLARDHVELFEQVKAGELSANAAAIKAGFRAKTATVVCNDADRAVRTLMKHYTADQIIAAVTKHVGEPKQIAKRKANSIPPDVEDVRQYCHERNNGIDAEAFMDFYESKGWLVGKVKMKNWQCAVRTAERGGYFREGGTNGRHQDRRHVEQQSSLRAIAQAAGTGESVVVAVPHETSGDVHHGGSGLLDFSSSDVPF